jgi:hypothetical protein
VSLPLLLLAADVRPDHARLNIGRDRLKCFEVDYFQVWKVELFELVVNTGRLKPFLFGKRSAIGMDK